MLSGKWHLGHTLDRSRHARGFERSFALLPAAAIISAAARSTGSPHAARSMPRMANVATDIGRLRTDGFSY
nr:hypothetical protein [Sphingopyxis sp. KK2]